MRIVATETSGMRGSVAALDGPKLLFQKELNPNQRSAQSLAPTIHAVLAEVGWPPRDIQLLAVTTGPGSFTGLRVGITTAKTMAYATGAALVGVNTLEAIAEQAPPEVNELAAAIDAQRQEVFAGHFRREADAQRRLIGEMAILPIEKWLADLPEGAVVTGPALAKIPPELLRRLACTPAATWAPMAAAVGQVAWRRFQAGERDDPFQLAPLYLRRSAAEEKAESLPPPLGGKDR